MPDLTDDADADDKTGAMIALLPSGETDWCKIDLPHMTLVYAGTTDKLSLADFNEMAKDAASIAQLSGPIGLRVTGVAVYGTDPEKVNVLTLMPTPELWSMRRIVEDWNASSFPFSPHCTIGEVALGVPPVLPSFIGFNKVLARYGESNLVFNMSRPSY